MRRQDSDFGAVSLYAGFLDITEEAWTTTNLSDDGEILERDMLFFTLLCCAMARLTCSLAPSGAGFKSVSVLRLPTE